MNYRETRKLNTWSFQWYYQTIFAEVLVRSVLATIFCTIQQLYHTWRSFAGPNTMRVLSFGVSRCFVINNELLLIASFQLHRMKVLTLYATVLTTSLRFSSQARFWGQYHENHTIRDIELRWLSIERMRSNYNKRFVVLENLHRLLGDGGHQHMSSIKF